MVSNLAEVGRDRAVDHHAHWARYWVHPVPSRTLVNQPLSPNRPSSCATSVGTERSLVSVLDSGFSIFNYHLQKIQKKSR